MAATAQLRQRCRPAATPPPPRPRSFLVCLSVTSCMLAMPMNLDQTRLAVVSRAQTVCHPLEPLEASSSGGHPPPFPPCRTTVTTVHRRPPPLVFRAPRSMGRPPPVTARSGQRVAAVAAMPAERGLRRRRGGGQPPAAAAVRRGRGACGGPFHQRRAPTMTRSSIPGLVVATAPCSSVVPHPLRRGGGPSFHRGTASGASCCQPRPQQASPAWWAVSAGAAHGRCRDSTRSLPNDKAPEEQQLARSFPFQQYPFSRSSWLSALDPRAHAPPASMAVVSCHGSRERGRRSLCLAKRARRAIRRQWRAPMQLESDVGGGGGEEGGRARP